MSRTLPSRPLRTRSRAMTAVPALALALAPLAPVAAAERPDILPLVTGSSPEGISAGPGTTFFAGARAGGAIYVGDVRDGSLRNLVPADGGIAVGLLYDAATHRLWVAGGTTGTITAYDARTGEQLYRVQTESTDTGDPAARSDRFLNDVAITRDAVYVTDSRNAQILVVPLGRGGSLPPAGEFDVLELSGDYVQPSGFGLNGIRVLPGGDLIVVSGGVLYVVDPTTGAADRVEVTGGSLRGGDGLVLRGTRLYVVRGFGGNSVVELRLDLPRGTARVVDEITDPDFDVPTTAALVAGDLLVVNGQFTAPLTAPTEVVRIDRP